MDKIVVQGGDNRLVGSVTIEEQKCSLTLVGSDYSSK